MDQQLLILFNRTWTHPTLDWIMATASSASVWLPFLILAAGLTLIFGGFRARSFILCAALILAFSDGLSARFRKQTEGRPRPNDVRNDIRIVDLGKASPRIFAFGKPLRIKMSRASEKTVAGRSFPSSHTVNNFAFATLAAAFFRRTGWLVFFPAALVGYSRIYVGSHYPSDVLVSIFLAVGQTLLILALFCWLWKKIGPRLTPRLFAAHPHLLA